MKFIVGVDEVGRGSLAGPVAVAAVALPKGLGFRAKNLGKLRDSKKLSVKQREAWFEYFRAHPEIEYAIARVYPRQIEKRNIARAANLAAERAFSRLAKSHSPRSSRGGAGKLKAKSYAVFLDGGLYLGNHRKESARNKTRKGANTFRANLRGGSRILASTIIRGDEKIKAIAAASIIAKVHRDRLMMRLAKKYPQYGLEAHKGYGTRAHMRAIERHGPSKIHRSTFLSRHGTIKL